jgi:uncharacterized integral membrane protein
MKFSAAAVIAILVIFTVFVFQNIHTVALKIFFWEFQMPLILMIFLLFVAGFISGVLFSNFSRAFRARPDRNPEI